MEILQDLKLSDGGKALMFFCPGCKYYHHFVIERHSPGPVWSWNGDRDKPTFSPSLGVNMAMPEFRCHLFMRGGKIEYLQDSFHGLAGTKVDMVEFDAES